MPIKSFHFLFLSVVDNTITTIMSALTIYAKVKNQQRAYRLAVVFSFIIYVFLMLIHRC